MNGLSSITTQRCKCIKMCIDMHDRTHNHLFSIEMYATQRGTTLKTAFVYTDEASS